MSGCAVTPVKLGSAAIVGDQRISIATLGTEAANLSQAHRLYPKTVLKLTVRNMLVLVSTTAARGGSRIAVQSAISRCGDGRGRAAGPDQRHPDPHPCLQRDPAEHRAALGRYEAIANEYLKIANGSTATAILYMPGRDCSIPV